MPLVTNTGTYSLKMWMSVFTEWHSLRWIQTFTSKGNKSSIGNKWHLWYFYSMMSEITNTGNLYSDLDLDLGGVPVYQYRNPVLVGRWIGTHIFSINPIKSLKRQREPGHHWIKHYILHPPSKVCFYWSIRGVGHIILNFFNMKDFSDWLNFSYTPQQGV